MDKLIEILANKWGFTIAAILGFVTPGTLFLFAFYRELFIQIDVIKLLVLSIGISFITYIPFFIMYCIKCSTEEKVANKKCEIIDLFMPPIVWGNMLIYFGIMDKVNQPQLDVTTLLKKISMFLGIIFLIEIIAYSIYYLRYKYKNKK